ncbi:hypothetical protein ACP4OV_005055 [Aristida adscensionis]
MAPRAAAAVILAVAVAAAACAGAASAQGGGGGGRVGRLVVSGVVPCSTGTLIDVATSPAFPDAKVELRCGGSAVAGARTSSSGSFEMEADMTGAVAALLGACEVVVDTPLAKCNATLPAAGNLVSGLQGSLAGMLGGVFRLAPAGFSFRLR